MLEIHFTILKIHFTILELNFTILEIHFTMLESKYTTTLIIHWKRNNIQLSLLYKLPTNLVADTLPFSLKQAYMICGKETI